MTPRVDNSYPIEIAAPDITPYKAGNTGIDYVTTMDSGKPGPHVMVTAVVHGNELCGAIALDYFFKTGLRPRAGKLTLAFCNVEAFLSLMPLTLLFQGSLMKISIASGRQTCWTARDNRRN